jgi:hypothetical protein
MTRTRVEDVQNRVKQISLRLLSVRDDVVHVPFAGRGVMTLLPLGGYRKVERDKPLATLYLGNDWKLYEYDANRRRLSEVILSRLTQRQLTICDLLIQEAISS